METIVVGVDGSPNSVAALRWAVDEATRRDAQLEVVHAFHVPYGGGGMTMPIDLDPAPFHEGAEHELEAVLAEVDLAGLQRPPARLVVEGTAAGSIIEAGKDASMIVVGARGHGGLVGMLLGSVSRQVSEHATVPVVVVPHEEES